MSLEMQIRHIYIAYLNVQVPELDVMLLEYLLEVKMEEIKANSPIENILLEVLWWNCFSILSYIFLTCRIGKIIEPISECCCHH